jgi:hypothetical protein
VGTTHRVCTRCHLHPRWRVVDVSTTTQLQAPAASASSAPAMAMATSARRRRSRPAPQSRHVHNFTASALHHTRREIWHGVGREGGVAPLLRRRLLSRSRRLGSSPPLLLRRPEGLPARRQSGERNEGCRAARRGGRRWARGGRRLPPSLFPASRLAPTPWCSLAREEGAMEVPPWPERREGEMRGRSQVKKTSGTYSSWLVRMAMGAGAGEPSPSPER